MIIVAAFGLVIAAVPLLGGHLSRLAHLELRWMSLLYVGLAIQLMIIEVLPAAFPAVEVLHLTSYCLAIVFLIANRTLPGMILVALGGLANLTVITANGGVMPASADALARAGRSGASEHFANSAATPHPRLAFLGDVFAVPAPFPLANVFSIGDVLLLIGGAVAVHAVCGSRLGRRRTARDPGASVAT
jgi:hypothetical protein